MNSIRALTDWSFTIHIFFLWIRNVELAVERVRARVLIGGHNIPDRVIRQRFDRSIGNFLLNYRSLADSWTLFNNSGETPALIASVKDDKLTIIEETEYEALIARYR